MLATGRSLSMRSKHADHPKRVLQQYPRRGGVCLDFLHDHNARGECRAMRQVNGHDFSQEGRILLKKSSLIEGAIADPI